MAMNQERLIVREHNSVVAECGYLIISAVETTGLQARVVVGRPGLPNVEASLKVGGAVLYETPDGLFEVRVLSTSPTQVEVISTHISPKPGIAAGFFDEDPSNTPFAPEELVRIATSMDRIRRAMSERADVTPEQLEFVSRKLDEMHAASERLGRKDWMNLAVGTLTSIVVTAAFGSAAAKALVQAAGAALSWIFGGGLSLLP